MFEYRKATHDDLKKIWDKDINRNPDDSRWPKWKDEYIKNNKENKCATFVVIHDGSPVGQVTLLMSPDCSAVKNKKLLCDGKSVANMNAFRIDKPFEGQGHISKLVTLAEKYAKKQGIKTLTIGAEATETRNLSIYFHFGYSEFVMSETENNTLILYYKKNI